MITSGGPGRAGTAADSPEALGYVAPVTRFETTRL
jgi:hypothetical protein